ncbi:MAG TPA: hypothetical protein VEJ18_00180 [Planctomycetota bacterium]|nr:hypothetical protein [Planctomycetota bacterium]
MNDGALPFKTKVALWFVGLAAVSLVLLTAETGYRFAVSRDDLGVIVLYGIFALGMAGGFLGLLRKTEWALWLLILELGFILSYGLLMLAYLALGHSYTTDPLFTLKALGLSLGTLVLSGTPFLLLLADHKAYAVAVRNCWRRT